MSRYDGALDGYQDRKSRKWPRGFHWKSLERCSGRSSRRWGPFADSTKAWCMCVAYSEVRRVQSSLGALNSGTNQPGPPSKMALHGEAARSGIKWNRTATIEIRREDPQQETEQDQEISASRQPCTVLEHYLNTLAGLDKVRATKNFLFESSEK